MRHSRLGEEPGRMPAEVIKIMSDRIERTHHQVARLMGKTSASAKHRIARILHDMEQRGQMRIVRYVANPYQGRPSPVYAIEQTRAELSHVRLESVWRSIVPQPDRKENIA